jgi:hypothetical protein
LNGNGIPLLKDNCIPFNDNRILSARLIAGAEREEEAKAKCQTLSVPAAGGFGMNTQTKKNYFHEGFQRHTNV